MGSESFLITTVSDRKNDSDPIFTAVENASREDRWSESVAVGSAAYVESVKRELDLRARSRRVAERDGAFALREPGNAYKVILRAKNRPLRQENAIYWE